VRKRCFTWSKHGLRPRKIEAMRGFCRQGHSFEEHGVIRGGKRRCRICLSQQKAEFARKKRAAERRPKPPVEQLIKDFERIGSYRGVGLAYGVSDNAVRKWVKGYDIFSEIKPFIRGRTGTRKIFRRFDYPSVFSSGTVGKLDKNVVYAVRGQKVNGEYPPNDLSFLRVLKDIDLNLVKARILFHSYMQQMLNSM